MQVVTLPNGTQVRRDDISYPDFEFGYTYYGKFCPQFSVHDSTDWGVKCAYHILGLESRAKDTEIDRLKAVADVWNPVSAMAAITESLKLANQEAEISRLRGMLEAVVSHAKEPAMSDGQFRQFAIENCEYTMKGGNDD